MSIALSQLSQILDLAGSLDDSPGSNTPRQRFRDFLDKNVTEVGQVRDYVQECLKTRILSTAEHCKTLSSTSVGAFYSGLR